METTHPTQSALPVIVTTDKQLQQVLAGFLPSLVRDIIKNIKTEELMDKLISPDEARTNCFSPAISRPTITSYEKQGYFNRYEMGGKVFYRYSEVMAAAKKIKRYSRNQIADA